MMNQRSYSPKRYGRSEYAPIVIDMVDYGNDDSADDYAYSLHFSSPHRHPTSNHQSSPRHATGTHHSSPRPSSGSRPSSPRHSRTSSRHKIRSPPFPSPSTNSREAVQVHNFAQRRSFMMAGGGYTDKDCQEQDDPDRIYHVEEDEAAILEYDEYQMDAALNDGISDNEYRQSPGRSRNFPIYDDADTRDRSVPIEVKGRRGAKDTKDYHDHHNGAPRDLSLHNIASLNKYDSYTATTPHSLPDHHKATFLVMDGMKRPEEDVFIFNDANDDDVHTVPGIINRHEERYPEDIRETMSVAPATEKKVFYFDIDDLSQRLLNNGDQDLSRRLRKKKQKNARNRDSRSGRSKSSKSKKSVFNLELDTSVTEILQSNNQNIDNRTVVAEPVQSTGHSGEQPDSQVAPDSNPRNALYVDTTGGNDRIHRAPGSPPSNVSPRGETKEKSLLRNPSGGSQPAEQVSMDYDELAYQQTKSNSSSPLDSASVVTTAGRSRRERPTPSDRMVQQEKKPNADTTADDRSTRSKAKSPKSSTVVGKTVASSEKRATKVYDEINNRLDHIVRREGDVENRQNAIRAVFEEVQQHVAELKKKSRHQTAPNEDKGKSTDDWPDSESKTKSKRNASDEGSEQVIKDAEIAFRMSEPAANENTEHITNSATVPDAVHEAVKEVSSDGEGDAAKSLSRPSAYLSSDNSCDDVAIHEQNSDAENDGSVYVVEEEEKNDVAQVDFIQADESTSSAKEQDTPEVEEDANGEDSAPYQFKAYVDEHDDGISHEPDGDEVDHATNVQDSKNAEEEEDEKHNRVEEARKRAIRGENVDKNVLDSDADEAEVDIDTEFDRVVPNDTESPSIDYNIDETLDRVARQTELEKNIRGYAEKSGGTSHGDDEEKANALLDGIGQMNAFADKHEPQSPTSDHTQSSQKSFKSEKSKHCSENFEDEAKATLSNRTRTDEEEDDDEVSMDYDFNLAISAATKSSDSASDLQEFPLEPKKEYDDQYDSGSSDVSSDLSVSSSESVSTESSYDSFISIVETEDDSDLEFFDEQEGFAENFMSNLVSSTFGWFEKKQEQLVCGFKSGEFDGPSLLRQSLTKKKQEEAEEEREKSRGKTMKNLHNAVATKYGGEKAALPMSNTSAAKTDRKKKNSTKKKETKRSDKHGLSEKQDEGRKVVNSPRQRNEKRNSVADSRKTSLLVNSKSSESDQNVQEASPKSDKEKSRRKSPSKSISDKHQDEEVTSRKSDAAVVVDSHNRKSNRKPISPATETSEPTDQYNFDFLNSEDDEAGLSSVKVLDFKSFDKEKKSALKKKGKGTEKATDPDEFVFIADDADSTAAAKTSRPRRSTKQPNGTAAQSPKSQRTLSPRRSGPMSPSSQSTMSKALSPRSISSVITAEKASSKRVSSKSPGKIMAPSKHTKSTKKTSKKEKTSSRPSKTSAVGSKRNQHTTSKRRATESRDRSSNTELEDKRDPSESDTDDNSMEMDDEEKEIARKERRRAAALKRRRKLRERRRAKLEQNLTDDTFG